MNNRRTARMNAFLVLYQGDVTERPTGEILERLRSYRGEFDDHDAIMLAREFDEHAIMLARGVEEEREDLDERLGEVSVGWPVHRMSAIDRTILRLALYEMLHVEDLPAEVAISEAIELARGFSGEEAPQFVSGVLGGAKKAWLGEADEGKERQAEHHDHPVEHG